MEFENQLEKETIKGILRALFGEADNRVVEPGRPISAYFDMMRLPCPGSRLPAVALLIYWQYFHLLYVYKS